VKSEQRSAVSAGTATAIRESDKINERAFKALLPPDVFDALCAAAATVRSQKKTKGT
jgi:hypothetical protein